MADTVWPIDPYGISHTATAILYHIVPVILYDTVTYCTSPIHELKKCLPLSNLYTNTVKLKSSKMINKLIESAWKEQSFGQFLDKVPPPPKSRVHTQGGSKKNLK